jgi:hypothetical protein
MDTNPDDEVNPLRNYTIPGRLWIIACITGGMLGFIAYVLELLPTFPPGSYPLVFFIVPMVLITLVIYVVGCYGLRALGIRLKKDE